MQKKLGLSFFDGDDYHPDANIRKMREGIPLTDGDRRNRLMQLNKPAGRELLKLFGLSRYARKELLQNYQKRITDTLADRDDAFFFKAPAVVILTYPATSNGRRFGRIDCALAGENMMLSAHARGIGSCMIGFAEAALFTKKLRAKAGVGPDRRIGLIFTLGYQKPVYRRYPKRERWGI